VVRGGKGRGAEGVERGEEGVFFHRTLISVSEFIPAVVSIATM
jgi:hypothetical protein